MKYIAKFEKVSFEQFKKDYIDTFLKTEEGFEPSEDEKLIAEIQKVYDTITIPQRATKGSAGYDFVTPISFSLKPNETIKIPTGIRAKIDESWVLKCYPRSGLGFKYRLQLDNTVGIIDSDYYYSDNEGHIFAKITNDSNEGKTVTIGGERYAVTGDAETGRKFTYKGTEYELDENGQSKKQVPVEYTYDDDNGVCTEHLINGSTHVFFLLKLLSNGVFKCIILFSYVLTFFAILTPSRCITSSCTNISIASQL